MLVGGARVTCQYAGQGGAVGLRHLCQQFGRELYLQTVELGLAGKALGGIRVAVGIGDVRLDVVDGGAIHQVGTAHDEHRANVRRVLPPRRGGRTVGDQLSRTAPENCHTSQM